MNVFDAKQRIMQDRDFIALKRFDYSLAKMVERYPEGAPDHVIAEALMMSEAEVEETYEKAVAKLRMIMGVET